MTERIILAIIIVVLAFGWIRSTDLHDVTKLDLEIRNEQFENVTEHDKMVGKALWSTCKDYGDLEVKYTKLQNSIRLAQEMLETIDLEYIEERPVGVDLKIQIIQQTLEGK